MQQLVADLRVGTEREGEFAVRTSKTAGAQEERAAQGL